MLDAKCEYRLFTASCRSQVPMAALAQHGREAGWAGSFECSGPCGRKRMVAADFSKKQVERRQKDPAAAVKCKQCVEAVAAEERQQAAARQAQRAASEAAVPAGSGSVTVDVTDSEAPVLHECSSCARRLGAEAFNRTQLVKGVGKMRCRECVEKSEQASVSASSQKSESGIEEARVALQKAEISGSAAQTLAASSRLAALEAEKVTGLKPVVLGKRGRGRGGSWRGRGKG